MTTFSVLALLTAVLALGPCPNPAKETCLRGGASASPCTGMGCPPCWIPQDSMNWGCYEKAMGPNNAAVCPPWAGMVDITMPPSSCAVPTSPTEPPTKPTDPPVKPTDPVTPPGTTPVCPSVADDTCYQGGHLEYPCQGMTCPPCWEYKNKQWDCYDPINGKCQWNNNLVDIRSPPANCQLPECE